MPNVPGLGPSAVPPIGEAKVVVYGTRTCPACTKLKSDLRARRVPFDFIDLEDPLQLNSPLGRASADMPANMRNGIPVTRVTQKSGQTVWVQGADAPKIEKAYRA
jgi:glutaredoxin